MPLQTIPIFYNISTSRQSNSGGVDVRENDFPLITEGQKDLVISIDYVRTGGGLVTDLFENTDTYSLKVSQTVDDSDDLLMDTTDSGFNIPGDRSDLDVTGGKHSFRMNADTIPVTDFLAQILDNETVLGQIDVFPQSVTEPKASFRLKIQLNNALEGTGPSDPVSNFYNKAETDALLGGKEELQTIGALNKDAKVAATHNVFSLPVSTRHIAQTGYVITTALTGPAGLPTIQFKTSGGIDLGPAVAMSALEGVVGRVMEFELDNGIIIPAADIVQAEITVAGTSTTHTVDFGYNGQEI